MTDSTTSVITQLIVGAVVILSVVATVAALTWHGSITGEACVTILSTVLGGTVVGGAVHIGNTTGARAAARGAEAAQGRHPGAF